MFYGFPVNSQVFLEFDRDCYTFEDIDFEDIGILLEKI